MPGRVPLDWSQGDLSWWVWQDVYARSLIIDCNENTAREFLVSPKLDAYPIRNDDPVLIEDVWRIVGDSPG